MASPAHDPGQPLGFDLSVAGVCGEDVSLVLEDTDEVSLGPGSRRGRWQGLGWAVGATRYLARVATWSAVPTAVLERFQVLVPGENGWQQRARLLQSQWREGQSLAPGPWPKDPARRLGSRLTDAVGAAGGNFLTPRAWADAQEALEASSRSGALVSRNRLLCNLLSSQPLCFNLFADLRSDLTRATRVLGTLWPEISSVIGIEYEYSPGRPTWTTSARGRRLTCSLCTSMWMGRADSSHSKSSTEDMEGAGYEPREATRNRLLELTQSRLQLAESAAANLFSSPLWQIWLDHLLAESMLEAKDSYAPRRVRLPLSRGQLRLRERVDQLFGTGSERCAPGRDA